MSVLYLCALRMSAHELTNVSLHTLIAACPTHTHTHTDRVTTHTDCRVRTTLHTHTDTNSMVHPVSAVLSRAHQEISR